MTDQPTIVVQSADAHDHPDDPDPALDHIDEPAVPGADQSLRDILRAARDEARSKTTVDIVIQEMQRGVVLIGRYRALTWKEQKAVSLAHQRLPADQKDLYVAADSLITASLDTIAVVDGVERPLGVTLGVALAKYLETDEHPSIAETDRQAVLVEGEIFVRDTAMMQHFSQLIAFQQGIQPQVDEELLGNSPAAS